MKNNEQDDLLIIEDELGRMAEDVPEIPADFHASWMRAVEEDMENSSIRNTEENAKAPKTKAIRFSRMKKGLAIAAAAVMLIGGTALTRDRLNPRSSNSASSKSAYSYDAGYGTGAISNSADYYAMSGMPAVEVEESAVYDADDSAQYARSASNGMEAPAPDITEKKIIRTVSLKIGTKAYDELYASIREKVTEMGGWVESANESSSASGLRTASMTLRVPQERLDEFTASIAQDGRMISRSESATDVTESYQDTQTRLATQKMMMERLQSLVTTAADLSDLLMLESQIAETQYNIDRLQASLNSTDRKVNYSTVTLTLKEETAAADVKNVEKTFGERLASAFSTGFEDLTAFLGDAALFLVSMLPVIACAGIVIAVVVIITRRRKAKKAARE
ncbi:MAG: DUF4349 domain-containing protein [Clostridia bacterium]|nr:DUF4349 domain-containing protein [Clostridia bacterium]